MRLSLAVLLSLIAVALGLKMEDHEQTVRGYWCSCERFGRRKGQDIPYNEDTFGVFVSKKSDCSGISKRNGSFSIQCSLLSGQK